MKKITFFLLLTMLIPCLSKAEFSIGLPGAIGKRGETVDRKIIERSIPSKEPQVNQLPVATIDNITPNPATQGTTVSFVGHGVDSNGTIVGHLWKSNISGTLSQSASFSTSTLPVGTHAISFSVCDDQGSWSAVSASAQLVVFAIATSTFQPTGYYGVIADGTYYISKSLVDAVNGSAPKVEFDPSWILKTTRLEGGYYVYSSGISLDPTKKQLFCFDIGGNRFLPHELVRINDSRLNMADVVDNTYGGYNFWMLPVGQQLPSMPVANFSGTPTSGVGSLTVQFTDQSTGSITTWSWQFGDGGTATIQNPVHTYTVPGTYTVSLTVVGSGGSNVATKSDYVVVAPALPPLPPAPVANFSGAPRTGTESLLVQFTDQSTGSITTWSWQFGDGGTATIQNPAYTYTTVGAYNVSLTVTGTGGSNAMVKVARWTFSLF